MAVPRKDIYTTGEAADISGLSQQTIIRCFDEGRVEGFRVPGSRFRRIPHKALLKFMKDNGMPLDGLEGGKIRVLVVDDDPDIVELLEDAMAVDGRFEVRTAGTGYEAGMLTQQFNPVVILLDFMLPDINGNVVCQLIRKNPDLSHMKVIMVSGVVSPAEVQTLLDAGADEFIKKPFNIEHLLERITDLAGA